MSEPELKQITLDVTFCTPNLERLAAVLGVVCPCQQPFLLTPGHTAACTVRRPKPDPIRARLHGWKNARQAMRYYLLPYPLHYRINGPEYRRRRRTR